MNVHTPFSCALLMLGISLLAPPAHAEASGREKADSPPGSRRRKVLYTAGTGMAVVTAWGIWQWDYFSQSPNAQSEGWFGAGTDSGGADKLGHLYSSYVAAHGFSFLYEHWDFDRREAALFGALTSFAVFGYMEFGDSFSSYGFSYEDLIANATGCLAGYLLYISPGLASKIDLRWEYGFSPSSGDIVTDYENSKYLMAIKLNGFEFAKNNLLRHIELHAGYYTRGFSEPGERNERFLYAGIGLNLTDLLFRHGYKKTGTVLRYLQIPYTSANYDYSL